MMGCVGALVLRFSPCMMTGPLDDKLGAELVGVAVCGWQGVGG